MMTKPTDGSLCYRLDDQQHATILAALRYYQSEGMSDPANRSDWIHQIATNGDTHISLDDAGIDRLCEHLNLNPEPESS